MRGSTQVLEAADGIVLRSCSRLTEGAGSEVVALLGECKVVAEVCLLTKVGCGASKLQSRLSRSGEAVFT